MEKIKKAIARRLYSYCGIKIWKEGNQFRVAFFVFGYPVSTFTVEYVGGRPGYVITQDLPF